VALLRRETPPRGPRPVFSSSGAGASSSQLVRANAFALSCMDCVTLATVRAWGSAPRRPASPETRTARPQMLRSHRIPSQLESKCRRVPCGCTPLLIDRRTAGRRRSARRVPKEAGRDPRADRGSQARRACARGDHRPYRPAISARAGRRRIPAADGFPNTGSRRPPRSPSGSPSARNREPPDPTKPGSHKRVYRQGPMGRPRCVWSEHSDVASGGRPAEQDRSCDPVVGVGRTIGLWPGVVGSFSLCLESIVRAAIGVRRGKTSKRLWTAGLSPPLHPTLEGQSNK
jgi:hypothetical protein